MNTQDHFAVRKIDKAFSMIAIDQPHKLYIVVIKVYIGTIGLTVDIYKAIFLSLSAKLLNLLGGLQNGIPFTMF